MGKGYHIKVITLTPLWTGDVSHQCNDVKPSGVVGSIRWWYEKILEGQGCKVYRVCSTTSNQKCNFELDYKKLESALQDGDSVKEVLNKQLENICPACQLFGCTGWNGKLSIHINPNGKENKAKYTVNVGTRQLHPNARRPLEGMMFDEVSPLKIYFRPLKDITVKEWKLLNLTLKTISKCGALGGRTAQGNGLIQIIDNNLPYHQEVPDIKDFEHGEFKDFFSGNFYLQFKRNISDCIDDDVFWRGQTGGRGYSSSETWKNLWDNDGILPIAFHVRDTIRRSITNESDRHSIFGKMGKGSHIFVSHGVKLNESRVGFRVWGYGLKGKTSKSKIYKALCQNLENNLFDFDKREV